MGFYFRKSIGVGPFRFNLSKSGIGVSTGIPGFRISKSPSGTYIHIGKDGFYYKQKLGFNSQTIPSTINSIPNTNQNVFTQESSKTHGPMNFIGTSTIDSMVDTNQDSVLHEIKQKAEIQEIWPFVFMVGLTISIIVFFFETSFLLKMLVVVISLVMIIWSFINDSVRKSVVLLYDIDEEYLQGYKIFCKSIEDFSTIKKIWVINSAGAVHDKKYHAGANLLISRSSVGISYDTPQNLKVNISIPKIDLGRIKLYLLPNEILLFSNNQFGSIQYSELIFKTETSRYVEDEGVPQDSVVVGNTWKYLNKDGSPDRRFNNNYSIPICLYEDLKISTQGGFQEIMKISKLGGAKILIDGIQKYSAELQKSKENENIRQRQILAEKINVLLESKITNENIMEEDDYNMIKKKLDVYEVLFGIICCIMLADGKITKSEKEKVRFVMSKVNSKWDNEKINQKIEDFIASYHVMGRQVLFASYIDKVGVFESQRQKQVVVKAIKQVMSADNVVDSKELELLDIIQFEMGMDNNTE